MVDYKEREKALKTLANDNDCHWIIKGILGSGCGLLEDALFQDLIVTIRNMIQSILGESCTHICVHVLHYTLPDKALDMMDQLIYREMRDCSTLSTIYQ